MNLARVGLAVGNSCHDALLDISPHLFCDNLSHNTTDGATEGGGSDVLAAQSRQSCSATGAQDSVIHLVEHVITEAVVAGLKLSKAGRPDIGRHELRDGADTDVDETGLFLLSQPLS